jgi:hypothetical protein
MDLLDFLFGKSALKKAAQAPAPTAPPVPPVVQSGPSPTEMMQRNQQYADEQRARKTATPAPPPAPSTAQRIAATLKQ